MDLQKFKDILATSESNWEQFCARRKWSAPDSPQTPEAFVDLFNNFEMVLKCAFAWSDTPEGYSFWERVCQKGIILEKRTMVSDQESQIDLETWVACCRPKLGSDIATHIDALTDLPDEQKQALWRCIMTSIRQEFENEDMAN